MKLLKIIYYLFDLTILLLKKKYIIISSYPKTGSTLLRMRLVSYINNLDYVNHEIVNSNSPEIGNGQIYKFLKCDDLLVVKTHHTLFLKILNPLIIISIFRDPIITMCSNFEYYRRLGFNDKSKSDINSFVSSSFGIQWYYNHVKRGLTRKNNSVNLFYEDYIVDPMKFHKEIFKKINYEFIDSRFNKVFKITSRKTLKELEKSSSKKNVKDFSKQKDYSFLIKKLNNKSLKKIISAFFLFDKLKLKI